MWALMVLGTVVSYLIFFPLGIFLTICLVVIVVGESRQPPPATPPTSTPSPQQDAPAPVPPPLVPSTPSPQQGQAATAFTRFVPLTCQNCGAVLAVYDHINRFVCGYCGVEFLVERREGSVSIRAVEQAIKNG